MFCKKCGSQVNGNFCTNCGTPIETNEAPVVNEVPTSQPENIIPVSEPVNQVPVTPVTETPVQTSEPIPAVPTSEPAGTVPVNEPVNSIPTGESVNTAPVSEPTTVDFTTPVTYPVYNTEKKSNLWFILSVIILSVIIVIDVVVIAVKSFSFAGKVETDDDIEDVVEKEESNTQKYNVAGYTFIIPDGFEVSSEDGEDFIGTTGFEIGVIQTLPNNTYANYKNNIDQATQIARDQMEAQGASYVSTEERTYDNQKFLIFTFSYNGVFNEVCLTELPDGTLLSFMAYFKASSEYIDGYKKVAKFVQSAKKDSTSTYQGTTFESTPKTIIEIN